MNVITDHKCAVLYVIDGDEDCMHGKCDEKAVVSIVVGLSDPDSSDGVHLGEESDGDGQGRFPLCLDHGRDFVGFIVEKGLAA